MQKHMLCVLLISCFALHASDIAQSSDEWDPKKPITALSSGGDVQVTAEDHAISYLEAVMGQKIQITDGSDDNSELFFYDWTYPSICHAHTLEQLVPLMNTLSALSIKYAMRIDSKCPTMLTKTKENSVVWTPFEMQMYRWNEFKNYIDLSERYNRQSREIDIDHIKRNRRVYLESFSSGDARLVKYTMPVPMYKAPFQKIISVLKLLKKLPK